MLRQLIGITAIIAGLVSCSDSHGRLVTAPTQAVTIPPATPGAPQNATPIALGQIVAQVVTAADPPCGIEWPPDPPEPCKEFVVSPDRRGTLKVRLTSSGPNHLTLRVGSRFYWGTAVEGSASVEPGSTYGIAVSLHGGKGTQSFELSAIVEPF